MFVDHFASSFTSGMFLPVNSTYCEASTTIQAMLIRPPLTYNGGDLPIVPHHRAAPRQFLDEIQRNEEKLRFSVLGWP
jgi:hypothetical protein